MVRFIALLLAVSAIAMGLLTEETLLTLLLAGLSLTLTGLHMLLRRERER